MSDIIFIGGLFSPQVESWVQSNSIGVIQYAADTLQKCFIEGLSTYIENIQVFNLPYVGSYPKFFKKPFFIGSSEIARLGNRDFLCQNISFNNLAIIKNWSRYKKLKKKLFNYLSRAENTVTLVVYATHSPFLKACLDVKKKYPNTRIVLIVPDLPEFMSSTSNVFMKVAKKINKWICEKSYGHMDAFVFLTESMNGRINLKCKPYTVIEGMYSQKSDISIKDPAKSDAIDNTINIKKIVYTGTLARRYGVLNLVEAFKKINREDIRLIIIGSGDAEDIILKESLIDKRISLIGQLSHDQVVKIQSQSFLLVNPRTSEGEFTKYSFPSKTMEYLASGTPTLLNKLPGIPETYYSYCFQPQDESVESLRKKIEEILSMPNDELLEMGNKARQFILETKNPASQCLKLIEIINRIN